MGLFFQKTIASISTYFQWSLLIRSNVLMITDNLYWAKIKNKLNENIFFTQNKLWVIKTYNNGCQKWIEIIAINK